MFKFKKSEIKSLVNKFTVDSDLFEDEVLDVTRQLTALSNSANEFGCAIEGVVDNNWGSKIPVVALPDCPRHEWVF